MRLYFVYMLLCADGTYYVGVTNNVERRFWQHNHGSDERAYTYTRRPVLLVHSSSFEIVSDAIAWEKRLKKWSHAKKGALARADWPALRDIVRCERRRRERSPNADA